MNSKLKKELGNYFLYSLRHPLAISQAGALLKHGLRKFNPEKTQTPEYLKEILKTYSQPEGKIFQKFGSDHLNKIPEKLKTLELATQSYIFNGKIEWKKKFRDEEDVAALHRWNWLLKALSSSDLEQETLRNWSSALAQSWAENFSSDLNDPIAWDPYNTSERICNLIFFSEQIQWQLPESLKQFLKLHADWILFHLEYYGEKNTFNHILNNARALFVYGWYFSSSIHRESAIRIFEHEIPKLITKEGFLREGSSHYHFLITRWLLETAFVALQFSDTKFMSDYGLLLSRMVQNTHLFLIFDKQSQNWEIPLIGDVSPDFSPEWLKTLPWSNLAQFFYQKLEKNIPKLSGWARIFPATYIPKGTLLVSSETLTDQTSGWHRFDIGSFTLIFYLRPEETFDVPGHYHQDFLSFCLFRKGSPILTDTGRFSYENHSRGFFGVTSEAHNSIRVDELDIIPFSNSALRRVYGSLYPLIRIEIISENNNSLKIRFMNSAFKRSFHGEVKHTRTIEMFGDQDQIQIEDAFDGKGRHWVEQYFHFAPNLKIEQKNPSELLIGDQNGSFRMRYSNLNSENLRIVIGSENSQEGWFFPAYGKRELAYSLRFKSLIDLPSTHQFQLDWSGA